MIRAKKNPRKRALEEEDEENTTTEACKKVEEGVNLSFEDEDFNFKKSSSISLLPPSVKKSEPILSSYIYSTVQDNDFTKRFSDDKTYQDLKKQEWVMGIDEAGRGPVLGPMVYGAAFCTKSFSEEKLKGLGFADSKTLSQKRREDLLESILNHQNNIGMRSKEFLIEERIEWNVKVLTPSDISQGMNRSVPYNLNAQAFDATCQIIRVALDNNYNLDHIFVDTLGPPKIHQAKLEKEFPTIKFTVCSKADSIFPIVSVASVIAKVTRDSIMSNWIHPEFNSTKSQSETKKGEGGSQEKNLDSSVPLGSGYPADPNTVEWLNENFDPVFGYGQIARFSWQTIKTILTKRGPDFKWNDEEKLGAGKNKNIQTYFESNNASNKTGNSSSLSKEFGLSSVQSL